MEQLKLASTKAGRSKTLFLASSLPYPANSGGQMRTLNILKYLAANSDVSMICPGNSQKDEGRADKLAEYCEDIIFVDDTKFGPHSNANKQYSFKENIIKWLKMEPWILGDFIAKEYLQALQDVDLNRFDVIVVRYPLLAHYLFKEKGFKKALKKTVVDVDDVLVQMQERRAAAMPLGYTKFRHYIEALFLRKYYKNLKKVTDCWVTSEKDKEYMEKNGFSKKVSIVPNTIEVSQGVEKQIPVGDGKQILFCGSLSFSHNIEAVMYFVDKVFPRIQNVIKDVTFVIIGKNPSPEILELNKRKGIAVHGNVASTKDYYKKASLVVVPMLNGAGTKIKMLEAMVNHRAVVATSVGAEGLDLTHGINTLIANDPYLFAKSCVDILSDAAKRAFIAENAYRFVRENYSLNTANKKMELSLKGYWNEVSQEPLSRDGHKESKVLEGALK